MTESEKNTREEPENTKKTQARTGFWGRRIFFLLLVSVLISGLIGGFFYFQPAIKSLLEKKDTMVFSPESGRLFRLEQRLNRQANDITVLKTTVQELQSRSNQPVSDPQWLARLEHLEQQNIKRTPAIKDSAQEARLDMLLNRMSQLEASFVPLSQGLSDAQTARLERAKLAGATQSQREKLDGLDKRLARLEQGALHSAQGALALFRIGELRRKIDSGQSYETEIRAVEKLIAAGRLTQGGFIRDSLDWFSRHQNGITSPNQLRQQFHALIPALVRAKTDQPDESWWQRAYNRVRNLILLRRTDPNAGDTVDRLIVRAEEKINQLDFAAALELLLELPENFRNFLGDWMARVTAYQKAQKGLDRLESAVMVHYIATDSNQDSSRINTVSEDDF